MGTLSIINAGVFDGVSDGLADGPVHVADGRIVSVGGRPQPADLVIDARGGMVLPGLIDAHCHAYGIGLDMMATESQPLSYVALAAARRLGRALARGFTTVRDPAGGDAGLGRAIAQNLAASPRYLWTGAALSQTGGHGDARGPDSETCPCYAHGCEVVDGVDPLRRAVRETRGNPLALLELPRGLTPAELAGGFGLPGAAPLTGRIEDSFARQLRALPAEAQRLLQLAAADPSGDRSLVWRAAGRLGIPVEAGAPAVEAGLVEFGGRVRFRHPLARSAVYRSAPLSDRQRLHEVLAEVTDPIADPDRRAWHRAQAAAAPDEEVAAELERSAGRAQARGGLAAAAAFLQRAVALTADPARHAERTLAAAQASLQAGAFDAALGLLATAEAAPLDEFQRARVDLLRGQIAFASNMGSDAPSLLLKAAKRLESLDLDLARETYLNAWRAASLAGRLAGSGDMLEVSRAARALPPPTRPLARSTRSWTAWRGWSPTARLPQARRCGRQWTSSPPERSPGRKDFRGAGWPQPSCGTPTPGARLWCGRSGSPGPSVRSKSCRSI